MCVYITLDKSNTAERVHVDFASKSFHIFVDNLGGRNYSLYLHPLEGSIKPDKCKWKVKSDSIVITLVKDERKSWSRMIEEKKKEEEKKPETNKDDPQAGLMDMMRKM